MKTIKPDLVLDCRCIVGESPRWDAETGRLTWVDLRGGAIHEYRPASGRHDVHEVGGEIGTASLTSDGRFLVAMGTRLAIFEPPGTFDDLAGVDDAHPSYRLNDGNVDYEGTFWVGSVRDDWREDPTPGACSLYRLDDGARITPVIPGLGLCNGLDWTSDGSALWLVDTLEQELRGYRIPMLGAPPEPFATIAVPRDWGIPDGLAVDDEGCLWLGMFGGGTVRRLSPDGELMTTVAVPVPDVTSCAFGGPRGDLLFITTAAKFTGPQRGAGGLFVCSPGSTGPPARRVERW